MITALCAREKAVVYFITAGGRRPVSEPSRPRRVYRMRGGNTDVSVQDESTSSAHAAGRDRRRILENVI